MHRQILLPNSSTSVYAEFKRLCDVDFTKVAFHEEELLGGLFDLFEGDDGRQEDDYPAQVERFFEAFSKTSGRNLEYADCICNQLYYDCLRHAAKLRINLRERPDVAILSSSERM